MEVNTSVLPIYCIYKINENLVKLNGSEQIIYIANHIHIVYT